MLTEGEEEVLQLIKIKWFGETGLETILHVIRHDGIIGVAACYNKFTLRGNFQHSPGCLFSAHTAGNGEIHNDQFCWSSFFFEVLLGFNGSLSMFLDDDVADGESQSIAQLFG